MVEGAGDKRSDRGGYTVGVLQNVLGVDAQDLVAVAGDEAVAFMVVGTRCRRGVDLAIDFDRELRGGAIEVDEIRPDRVLLAEPDSGGLAAEALLTAGPGGAQSFVGSGRSASP